MWQHSEAEAKDLQGNDSRVFKQCVGMDTANAKDPNVTKDDPE